MALVIQHMVGGFGGGREGTNMSSNCAWQKMIRFAIQIRGAALKKFL